MKPDPYEQIYDAIQLFECDPNPTGEHIARLLDIMARLLKQLKALDRTLHDRTDHLV